MGRAVEFLPWKNGPVQEPNKKVKQIQFSIGSFLVEGKESLGCNELENAYQL